MRKVFHEKSVPCEDVTDFIFGWPPSGRKGVRISITSQFHSKQNFIRNSLCFYFVRSLYTSVNEKETYRRQGHGGRKIWSNVWPI